MSAPTIRPAATPAPFLPYGRQSIGEDDIAAVAAALRDDMLTTGPRVAAFERAFAAKVEAPFAVAVANGTAALHLAMLALDLAPGDVCIVPTITFLATANAVRFAGGEVVFADVDPDTALMTPDTLRAALARAAGRRVRAILPVHYAGPMADTAALAAIAAEAGAVLIEDSCHALGSRDARGDAAGACRHAAMGCFSFHPVKTIACGEGGMITTRDPALADRLMRLRSHGMQRDLGAFQSPDLACDTDGGPAPWAYEMPEIGYNYRLTDMQCALGLSQFAKLDAFLARRAALVGRYRARLIGRRGVDVLAPASGQTPGWHLLVALIDFAAIGAPRRVVMERLRAHGVGSQVHYVPVHRQTYYRDRYGALDLPGAERFYARCLSLPLFPDMTDADVDRVVEALDAALA
ncbi:MAG: UDP-4-amino-4,6-dideoxy-N-acetyl-beta-L-altrosamine transaminase [Alphaproteobacteria bacterium]|nr:UDP-4-amino-4,6-dideoxy-N-acetyl-beta-L-altrosamine transaminase [Alphaproteobacteria bacterium]